MKIERWIDPGAPIRGPWTHAVDRRSIGATAAVATSATTTSVSASAATATLAVHAGLGLVDREVPPVVVATVEAADGVLRLGVGAHLHEPEPLGPVSVPVDDDLGALDRPER